MSSLKTTLKSWPIIAIATISLCFLTQLVAGWFGVDLKEQTVIEQMRQMGIYTWRILTQEGLATALKQEASCKFLINIPLVLVIAPVFEELLFRGLLWRLPTRALGKRRKTEDGIGQETEDGRRAWVPAAGAVVSSALFSAAHYLQFPFPDDAFLALFFFGLAQCWLYTKTDRLWCAILNHSLFNFTNLILLFLIPAT